MKQGSQVIDLSGRRFGRLTVLRYAGKKGPLTVWFCRCDCGQVSVVRGCALKSGNTQSCGCYRREQNKTHSRTHGLSKSSLYYTWLQMRYRCSNPNNSSYHNYGARGIRVCRRWERFVDFLADMGARPSLHHTLERIDNNGPYSPQNCVWALRKRQCRNKRNNVRVAFQGQVKTLIDWAELTDIKYTTIYARLKRGWCSSRALTQPVP